MRVILERDENEDILEFILSESDIAAINESRGTTREFFGILLEDRKLNILIRKENHGEDYFIY
jgi:hypothetical protein